MNAARIIATASVGRHVTCRIDPSGRLGWLRLEPERGIKEALRDLVE